MMNTQALRRIPKLGRYEVELASVEAQQALVESSLEKLVKRSRYAAFCPVVAQKEHLRRHRKLQSARASVPPREGAARCIM
jgi:hypothetical protein